MKSRGTYGTDLFIHVYTLFSICFIEIKVLILTHFLRCVDLHVNGVGWVQTPSSGKFSICVIYQFHIFSKINKLGLRLSAFLEPPPLPSTPEKYSGSMHMNYIMNTLFAAYEKLL